MKVTKKWLIRNNACQPGADEWIKKIGSRDEFVLIKSCMDANRFDHANWYISRRLNKTEKIRYANYAAKQVLNIFEEKYPDDKRPRNAINAIEAYLKDPKDIATQAAAAAYAAADTYAAAYAADAADAAYAATDAAAYAAAYAATDAADAAAATDAAAAAAAYAYAAAAAADAYAAAGTDAAATDAADAAADAAGTKIEKKIINYGIKLIKKMK